MLSLLFVFCQFCHSFQSASPFKDKCNNNFNGPGKREDQSEINIWTPHDWNAAFDATKHVRVLTDESSKCVPCGGEGELYVGCYRSSGDFSISEGSSPGPFHHFLAWAVWTS